MHATDGSANSSEVFSIEHVRKSFGGNEVLHDITVQVREGEVVAIIGPSGSGKSTLLRCSTMLETMDSGTLSFDGEPIARDVDGRSVYADKRALRAAKSKFGLVFQNFNLFPHYTVMRNVTDAPVCVQGRDKAEVEAEARDLLDQMGLADKADAVPCQLSGGQQQRVGIARALALNPRILFFDEPTSALDPELTAGILKVIRDLAARRMTMVIVTHEMGFARDVADRIVFMEGGNIVEQGPARQLIEHPTQARTREFLHTFED